MKMEPTLSYETSAIRTQTPGNYPKREQITKCTLFTVWAGIAQSVWRRASGWTVRGSNPGGVEIFRTRPDRPWGSPSLLYDGYQIFPGGKAAGAWP